MNNKIPSNPAYKLLAKLYDQTTNLMVFDIYKKIIGQAKGQKMLDLGCGTGSLMKHYSSLNSTNGIDGSPAMIEIARKKDKKTKYLVSDIRNFKINKKFDIITCVYDTINHLPNLKDWEMLFKSVARHLNDNAIFIFDFNTIGAFKNYSGRTFFKKIGQDYIVRQVKFDNKICYWKFHNFTKTAAGLYKHEESVIQECTFPTQVVLKKVKKHFSIIKTFKEGSNRIIIKAKKKAA